MGSWFEEGSAFDVDNRGFNFDRPCQNLKSGKLVIFYANATAPVESDCQIAGLSPAETSRHQMLKCPEAARRFLRGRVLIRSLLASHLGVAEGQIELTCQDHVKPEAYCRAASIAIPKFNLSHSGEWIVLGIHQDKKLGIDIECLPPPEIDTLIDLASLFTRNERRHLAGVLGYEQRSALFLQIWRRKEAVMKATGLGFALDPDSFDVLNPDGTFRTTIDAEGETWRVCEVMLRPGLDCAIASQHVNITVPPKERRDVDAGSFDEQPLSLSMDCPD